MNRIRLEYPQVRIDVRIDGAEDRMKAVGRASSGRILVAVFTFRGEAIRPFTAYDATIRDQNLLPERLST